MIELARYIANWKHHDMARQGKRLTEGVSCDYKATNAALKLGTRPLVQDEALTLVSISVASTHHTVHPSLPKRSQEDSGVTRVSRRTAPAS